MPVDAFLFGTAALYAVGVARLWRSAGVGRGIGRAQAAAFFGGIIVLFVALELLHELSEQLFAAHMVQHELIMLVAAPLVAVGAPLVACMWALPAAGRRKTMFAVRRPAITALWSAITAPAVVWLLHAIALWTWHLPSLYEAALGNELVHAAQHLSFFSSAVLFWWGLAHGRYGRIGYGAAVVYIFATAVHSGVLGALLTFSPHVWYAVYAPRTPHFALTPLEDQQLAGLVMWVPASLIFVAGGLIFFAAWLRESERRTRFVAQSPQRTQKAHGVKSTLSSFLSFLSFVSFAFLVMLGTSACDRQTYRAAMQKTGGDPTRGKIALRRYGCDTCHQIPGVRSSTRSHVGPPLTAIADRTYLAGYLPNEPATMQRWIRHPREIDPRTAMPDTGVSESDGRDIAAYLYTLR